MTIGVVKFFNAEKGFGFITPDNGAPDVFVHISGIIDPAGLHDGDQVSFDVVTDRRSGKSSATDVRVEVAAPRGHKPAPPTRTPEARGRGSTTPRGKSLGEAAGAVTWFNATKGYGFIRPDAGGPDIFVHTKAVERAGFSALAEGQRVTFDVFSDNRSGKLSAENLRLS